MSPGSRQPPASRRPQAHGRPACHQLADGHPASQQGTSPARHSQPISRNQDIKAISSCRTVLDSSGPESPSKLARWLYVTKQQDASGKESLVRHMKPGPHWAYKLPIVLKETKELRRRPPLTSAAAWSVAALSEDSLSRVLKHVHPFMALRARLVCRDFERVVSHIPTLCLRELSWVNARRRPPKSWQMAIVPLIFPSLVAFDTRGLQLMITADVKLLEYVLGGLPKLRQLLLVSCCCCGTAVASSGDGAGLSCRMQIIVSRCSAQRAR